MRFSCLPALLTLLLPAGVAWSAEPALPEKLHGTFETYCYDCHDSETKKGNLDLTALPFDLQDAKTFAMWVKVHDRVSDGEMPPKKKKQPSDEERTALLETLSTPMLAAEDARVAENGRSLWRRLNRYEYENSLRDLLGAPWLQVKEMLPEDGEAYRFNKVGEALDVSHVQMGRYLNAADYALREVLNEAGVKPINRRFYSRESTHLYRRVQFGQFNKAVERTAFALIGDQADLPFLAGKAPATVGRKDPAKRELEAIGVVCSTYEPIEIGFNEFEAPASGKYRLRLKAYSFWSDPESPAKWWKPSREHLSAGRTQEPVTLYSEAPPRLLRRLGTFDVQPDPTENELTTYLLAGETIRPDAVRLFRSRPGISKTGYHNPLATPEGCPGVAFNWLEVEGPIPEDATKAGFELLYGGLQITRNAKTGAVELVSAKPQADLKRLLKGFLARAYRRPVEEGDLQRFTELANRAFKSGASFTDTLIAVYSAVLCSPEFVTLEEKPGPLDDYALASRLSYFLWNSEPDPKLRWHASKGVLHNPATLRLQVNRMMADPRSQRFVEAFLDYWLDLRKVAATSPDGGLYGDYYLDDYLVESCAEETRRYFAELVKGNLPARNLVASDFVIVNERLAKLYDLPDVVGTEFRRVAVPKGSPRGGLLTQASVLKVTANGTTTSPVVRGVWINERILGRPVPPPPTTVPAIEPDTRGATTIREQLEKHRTVENCQSCHSKIDPAGFALESFDVVGGWRDHYRVLGEKQRVEGYGHNGQPFEFHPGPSVDSAGALPDGQRFNDILEMKQLLLKDERQIARNLVRQLVVFATGAPVRFGDRPEVERILDAAAPKQYGVRTLINALIESKLFLNK